MPQAPQPQPSRRPPAIACTNIAESTEYRTTKAFKVEKMTPEKEGVANKVGMSTVAGLP